MSISFCFNEVTLSPVSHQNSIWIRAVELARALGYSSEDKVSRIYRRNAEEFTSDMTQVIENVVEAQNGLLENLSAGRCRIFSLRGCHLLAMFARTPVAKAFRRWVLDIIDEYGDRVPVDQPVTLNATAFITPEQQSQLKALVDAKVGMLPATVQRKAFAEIWSRFGRHFQIARYVQLPAERMGDAVEYLVGMELRTGKAALPERTAPELPPAPRRDAPAVLKVTERECQALTDDITRAHIEAMRLLKPVKDRLSNIALRLAIETEQRAGMRALRHGEGESLQGMLFAGTGRMFAEAVMYPNEYELPVYCNPGFFLLGICRQLRAGDRA